MRLRIGSSLFRGTSVIVLLLMSVNFAQDSRRQEEIKRKIAELEAKRRKVAERQPQLDNVRPSGSRLQEIIARYEKLLGGCTGRKSERCADVIYTLGNLYYDESRDAYIQKREEYEKAMEAYSKTGRGPEPVNPIPDYSKPLGMYERLNQEYPDFPKLSEAYYQMGTIYLLMGDLDKSKDAFANLVNKFPKSPRTSSAYFRLADLTYLDHDMSTTIKYLEKINQNEVDIQSWEMVNYRKAEVYYNLGDLDKAVDLFHTYVENCDANIYPKKEFRDMALEFMAISFSDMGDGAKRAIDYFKRVGKKPYEDYVMYTIGLKNRTHGQFDDAIVALTTALKRFPNYKEAPTARQALIECYVVKKEHEKANQERVRLVDDYVQGSEWFKYNKSQLAVIEKSQSEMRRALGHIAIYYHALAQKKKDRSAYEMALKRYEEYFVKFPGDKWKTYEFKYNVAEIYNALNDCAKAAESYDYVAMQDLSTYPKYSAEVDTLGVDADDAEKMKKEAGKGPTVISQEDAGYNVIVALDKCKKQTMSENGITDDKAYELPETKKLLEYTERFQQRFPKSSNSPEVLYLAGNVHFSAKSYDNAIRVFKQITDNYPDAKVADKANRMLANSYTSNNQYDMAMGIYRKLLSREASNSPEYTEVLDLAAGAMYKRAEGLKKDGNADAAVQAFKSIYTEFPTSKVADRGWFEAAVIYEEQKNYAMAALVLEELPGKFPKSTLKEKAFLRAAENYKSAEQWEKAAQVYQTAANNITNAEFAIPSLSSASECYQKVNQFDMAGKMFEMIYERYNNDPKTPQALYNAGLIFEKGKLYPNAINVYDILAKRFEQSEYAAEAFFSIGLCYEKMEQHDNMAKVFSEYAQKFAGDRFKQVQALVKAADAYFNMKNYAQAKINYGMATSIYEKFKKEADIDVASIATAYYRLGEISYMDFQRISLTTKNERAMKDLIKNKTKALEEPAKQYAKAIELGIAEWTVRSTFMIGMGFVDMAEAVANQSLFGSAEQRIASRIRILSSLDKYYEKAQEYFFKNIDWAHTQNIKGEYVEKSIDRFMEMLYKRGWIMEQVGVEFASAPIPRGLSPEEVEAFRGLLEEKKLEAMDMALPKYEDGIRAAKELGIANSEWVAKIKGRIQEINPTSEMLSVQIDEWKPSEQQKQTALISPDGSTDQSVIDTNDPLQQGPRDEEFDRNMSRIRNIMNMSISMEEKIKQLNRIEMDAKRNIVLEEEKIKDLKENKNM
ncbi:MAG: tetratricopeptide repeat protein [Chitinispirillaceae bacterium]|nr:tetratricopeptide repeat protein [Chitinispirillaceae bacterium]